MHDETPFTSAIIKLLSNSSDRGPLAPQTDFDKAIRLVLYQLIDSLLHGFFEMNLKCAIGNGKRRELVVQAGKSHLFVIEPKFIPRCP